MGPTDTALEDAPDPAMTRWERVRHLVDRGVLRTLLVAVLCVVGAPTPQSLAFGAVVVAIGCALHVWAKGCLRIRTEVTSSGPYAWVRNPFYVANLIVEAGYCVVAARMEILPVYLIAWLLVYVPTIRREEERMRSIFGAQFDAYVRAVPRLVPWRGRVARLATSQAFDWGNSNLARGREYPRVVRMLMAPLLLVVAAQIRLDGFEVIARAGWFAGLAAIGLVLLEILRRVLFRHFKQRGSGTPARSTREHVNRGLRQAVADAGIGSAATVGRSTSTRVPADEVSTRMVPPLR